MLFRLKLALVVIGGVMVFFGVQEMRVSSGTTADPAEVDLAELERERTLENNHIKVGDHVALYSVSLYQYEATEFATGEPGPGTKVTHCYYPIISLEHPFIAGLARLDAEYGGLENVPDSVRGPDITDFALLVKSKRFKTVGSIPDEFKDESSVQGLVINRIASLDSEEKKLIKDSFPAVDLDNVLILQEGRKPASAAKWMGLTFGGGLLAMIGVALFFVGRGEGRT